MSHNIKFDYGFFKYRHPFKKFFDKQLTGTALGSTNYFVDGNLPKDGDEFDITFEKETKVNNRYPKGGNVILHCKVITTDKQDNEIIIRNENDNFDNLLNPVDISDSEESPTEYKRRPIITIDEENHSENKNIFQSNSSDSDSDYDDKKKKNKRKKSSRKVISKPKKKNKKKVRGSIIRKTLAFESKNNY